MIDALHEGGIEIVSPSVRNVRTYNEDKAFVPAQVHHPSEPSQEGARVDVVFDKAESAEDEELLQHQHEELETAIEKAREEAKQASTDDARSALERRVASLEGQKERLAARMAQRKAHDKGTGG